MLRDIKQKSSGLGAKIVMGLLIIAFAFWGVSGSLMSANNDSAASVNGEKITINKFNQSNQSARNRLTSQFGDNIGSEYFDSINFKRGVMNQLVDAELLKQEAEKFDYDVAPDRVKEYITSSEGLQVDGKFSKEAYANYLAQVSKSAELLQREIKGDLKSSALPLLVNQSAFSLNIEVENQYKLSKQKRSFNYIELSSKDYQDKVEVSDEEITDYFKEFAQDYMTIEQVSVNYIELSTSDLLSEIELSDDEIQDFYDARKETLMTAEKRKAQHILLPVNDNAADVKIEIEKIEARLAAGEDFAEVAKEVSKDPGSAKNGGELGWVSKGDMVEAFEEKLFAMKVGEVSEPVLSSFGYHIIKLSEIKLPEIPTLEEIKDQLVEELKNERAEKLFLTKANNLDEAIVDADNVLEVAADALALTVKTTELFEKGRGLGIAANPKFSAAAFSDLVKLDNEISEMIDLGENHIAYIHIKEHNLPTQKPLEDVKVTITTKLKSDKALDLVKQVAVDMVENIKSGEKTLTDVVTELEKTLVEVKDIERVGSKEPFNLVKNVFALKFDEENPVITSVESSTNAYAIVELKSVTVGDVSSISDEERTSIGTQIERSISNSELINITTNLRNSASITINEKIFDNTQQ